MPRRHEAHPPDRLGQGYSREGEARAEPHDALLAGQPARSVELVGIPGGAKLLLSHMMPRLAGRIGLPESCKGI